MLNKLQQAEDKYLHLEASLSDPIVAGDPAKCAQIAKEYKSLTPIIEKYREFKDAQGRIDDALLLLEEGDEVRVRSALEKGVKTFRTSEAYTRATGISDEILSSERLDSAFLLPLLKNSTDFFSILPENAVVSFDESKTLWDKFNALYKEHEERFHRLQTGGEAFDFTRGQYVDKDQFVENIQKVRRVAMQTFTGNPFFFQPLQTYNFTATPTTNALQGTLETLIEESRKAMEEAAKSLDFVSAAKHRDRMRELQKLASDSK